MINAIDAGSAFFCGIEASGLIDYQSEITVDGGGGGAGFVSD
jgi:hypothetical protein